MRFFLFLLLLGFIFSVKAEAAGVGSGIDIRLKTPSAGVTSKTASASVVKKPDTTLPT